MKRALAVSLVGILAVASAWYVWGTQQPMKGTGIPGPEPTAEPEVLQVEPIVLEHFLGSYSNRSEEGFFVIPGTLDEVREELRRIASGEQKPRSRFSTEEQLNFVVFRGVFPTGGYGVRVDSVQRAGNTFTVRVTYTAPQPGAAVTQAFTQPTVVIPIGTLPPGKYRAKLHVIGKPVKSVSFTVE